MLVFGNSKFVCHLKFWMLFYGLGVDYKKAALRLIDVFQYSLDSTVQILAFTYLICIQITEDFFLSKISCC